MLVKRSREVILIKKKLYYFIRRRNYRKNVRED